MSSPYGLVCHWCSDVRPITDAELAQFIAGNAFGWSWQPYDERDDHRMPMCPECYDNAEWMGGVYEGTPQKGSTLVRK
jgi:hypothetical protein